MTIRELTKRIVTALLIMLPLFAMAQQGTQQHFKILKGEHWYGGVVDEGIKAPYQPGYTYNLSGYNNDNQSAPLLLSSSGRYIWSNQPFKFSISEKELLISGNPDSVNIYNAGTTLADAFKAASRNHFRASGLMPDQPVVYQPAV